MTTIVFLRARDPQPGTDRRVHQVVLARETNDAWHGTPEGNSSCPELEYPKFAWNLAGVLTIDQGETDVQER